MSPVCKPVPDPVSIPGRQRGVSLVELLVGLLIALVVMGGAFAAFVAVTNSSRTNIRADRINVDVQTLLDLMANDIRRAGYTAIPGTGNPFSRVSPVPTPPATSTTSSCFLYSYDYNGNGIRDAQEFFGFRVTGGRVEIRSSGSSDIDCNNGTWQPLSDPNVMRVADNGLQFTITNSAVSAAGGALIAERRYVTIQLTATSTAAADAITKVARTSVEIRNDRRTP